MQKKLTNRYITDMCNNCSGSGLAPRRCSWMKDEYEECWKCHGTGLVPNEQGREILELVNLFYNTNYRSVYLDNYKQAQPTR